MREEVSKWEAEGEEEMRREGEGRRTAHHIWRDDEPVCDQLQLGEREQEDQEPTHSREEKFKLELKITVLITTWDWAFLTSELTFGLWFRVPAGLYNI